MNPSYRVLLLWLCVLTLVAPVSVFAVPQPEAPENTVDVPQEGESTLIIQCRALKNEDLVVDMTPTPGAERLSSSDAQQAVPAAIPEPSSLLLFGLGLGILIRLVIRWNLF